MELVSFFGIKIAVGKKRELLSSAMELIGKGGVIFTPNCLMVAQAHENGAFGELFSFSSINVPDGVGLAILLRRYGIKSDVLSGVELGELLLGGRSFAIIGGADGRAELAAKRLEKRVSGAVCLFTFSGYNMERGKIKESLRINKPDICIVCLGSPKQEFFIKEIKDSSPKTLFLALGGAVDVYSGKIRRAPRLIRALGLEWLYRMIRQPKRLVRLPKLLSFFMHSFFSVLNKNGVHKH